MNPVVSVGSKPPSSSMEDCFSSYRPCRVFSIYRTSYTVYTTYLFGRSALDNDVALVELQTDNTVDGALAGGNRADDELTLGREPVAVVEDPAELDGDELVAERADIAVERETLDVHVRDTENGRRRGLVASTRLDADEAVLDDVDAADAVLAGERVELEEHIDRVGVLLVLGGDGDLHRQALLELDGNPFRGGGGVFGSGGQLPHVIRWCGVGVLKDACLVRNVEQVLVGRPRLRNGLSNRDLLLSGVRKQSLTSSETTVEFWGTVSKEGISWGWDGNADQEFAMEQ